MKPVKIAQIGSGHDHAPSTFRSIQKLTDCFELIGFAESNPKRKVDPLYDTVPRYTVEELLAMPDLEAVAVECEEEYATEVAQPFAEKGLAVHIDKPGSQNIASFEKLIETLRSHNAPFHQGYMYRYNPAVKHMLSMVRSGQLGEIYSVEAHMDCLHTPEKRQWLGNYKGGMLYFLGCHLIDMIIQIQGFPKEIIPLSTSTRADGVTSEDYGMVVLKYDNGISFAKTCANEVNGYLRRQLVVTGTKGTYEIKPWEVVTSLDNISTCPKYSLKEDCTDWSTDGSHTLDFGEFSRYDDMMRSFAEIIRGAENPYSYDYELQLFKTVMACCDYHED